MQISPKKGTFVEQMLESSHCAGILPYLITLFNSRNHPGKEVALIPILQVREKLGFSGFRGSNFT